MLGRVSLGLLAGLGVAVLSLGAWAEEPKGPGGANPEGLFNRPAHQTRNAQRGPHTARRPPGGAAGAAQSLAPESRQERRQEVNP